MTSASTRELENESIRNVSHVEGKQLIQISEHRGQGSNGSKRISKGNTQKDSAHAETPRTAAGRGRNSAGTRQNKLNPNDYDLNTELTCEVLGKVLLSATRTPKFKSVDTKVLKAFVVGLALVPASRWGRAFSNKDVRDIFVEIVVSLLFGDATKAEEIMSEHWDNGLVMTGADREELFAQIKLSEEEIKADALNKNTTRILIRDMFLKKNEIDRSILPWIMYKVWQRCQCVGDGDFDEAKQFLGKVIADRAKYIHNQSQHACKKLTQCITLPSTLQKAVELNLQHMSGCLAEESDVDPEIMEEVDANEDLNDIDDFEVLNADIINGLTSAQIREKSEQLKNQLSKLKERINLRQSKAVEMEAKIEKMEELIRALEKQHNAAAFIESVATEVEEKTKDFCKAMGVIKLIANKLIISDRPAKEIEKLFFELVDLCEPDLSEEDVELDVRTMLATCTTLDQKGNPQHLAISRKRARGTSPEVGIENDTVRKQRLMSNTDGQVSEAAMEVDDGEGVVDVDAENEDDKDEEEIEDDGSDDGNEKGNGSSTK